MRWRVGNANGTMTQRLKGLLLHGGEYLSKYILAHCILAPLGTCQSTGPRKSICAREGKVELPEHWEGLK